MGGSTGTFGPAPLHRYGHFTGDCAVIPGEPLEIAAGYAFGAVEGTILCVLGTFLGGILVFLLVRRFGLRAVEIFFSPEKLQRLRFLHKERRLARWVFLIFFLPGTPKV